MIVPDFADKLPPVPDEFKDKIVNILCNDCLEKNTIKWHYFVLACPSCRSINTNEI
jgi:Zn finger protein HypA/HybF involved in hydrogenase expression